jgi:ATP-dependent helicase/nuclease subunit A
VVILYRLTQGLGERGASVVHERRKKAIEFRNGDEETAGFAAAAAEEQARRECENLRLLYVACTRARDLLVIPAYYQSDERAGHASSFVSVLQSRCPRGENGRPQVEGTGFRLHETNGFNLDTEPQEGLLLELTRPADGRDIDAARAEREQWEQARAAAAARRDHSAQFVRPSEHRGPLDEPPLARQFSSSEARDFGKFVHGLLQHVALPKGENLAAIAETAEEGSTLSESLRKEGMDLVQRALTSPLFVERIARAERICRELVFTAEIEGALIEGAMDLVFFENGEAVIVDFKTDKVTRDEVAVRAETYRSQARAYVRALEAVLKRPVREVLLHFLRPDVTVAFGRDNLQEGDR